MFAIPMITLIWAASAAYGKQIEQERRLIAIEKDLKKASLEVVIYKLDRLERNLDNIMSVLLLPESERSGR